LVSCWMDSDVETAASASEDEGGTRPHPPAPATMEHRHHHHRRHHHKRNKHGNEHMPHTSEEDEASSSSRSSPSHSSSSRSSSSSSTSPSSSSPRPPPTTPAVTELGKSSVQANAQLMSMFASMAAQHEDRHPFRSLSSFLHFLLSFDCVCGLYAAAVCVVGYGYTRVVHMLVEGLLLLLLVAAVIAINMWRTFLEVRERPTRILTITPQTTLHSLTLSLLFLLDYVLHYSTRSWCDCCAQG
jgi:hypothetical protein